jgi:hypothetical protein
MLTVTTRARDRIAYHETVRNPEWFLLSGAFREVRVVRPAPGAP